MSSAAPDSHRSTIGLDLGGTKILGVHVVDGEIVDTRKRSTPRDGVDAIVDAMVEMSQTFVEKAAGHDAPSAIGIGAPGVIEPATGVITGATNLVGFDRRVALGDLIKAGTGLPTRVDNDVNVAMLAEQRFGAAQDVDDALGVFIGTGVGGGFILDGSLRRGPNGLAGEIGHLTVQPGGRLCGCGGRGHLESYAGRASLEREARAQHSVGRATTLVDLAGDGRMKSSLWERSMEAGDELAIELIDQAADALGAAIASIAVIVDIDRVIIGGGLGERLGASFRERAVSRANKLAFGPIPELVTSGVGDQSGALGAAVLALGD